MASYAASKAFLHILGESLWAELRPAGVDAITILAGATRTPRYLASGADAKGIEMQPHEVAEEALAHLYARRRPSAIVGWKNRLAAWLLALLPRRRRVGLMSERVGPKPGA
jgi:short-subunit dehydrogenase